MTIIIMAMLQQKLRRRNTWKT